MATAVDICSNALLMLGAKPIASLDDSDADEASSPLDRVRLCSSLYPLAKAAFLRKHTWSCAIRRVVLAPDTTLPAFGWDNRFRRPPDWIRTIQVGRDEQCMPDYRTEAGFFLANDTAFYLTYCADVDETMWDTLMVDVMTKRMAAELAYPITRDSGQKQLTEQAFAQALQEAKTIDGQDDPPNTIGSSILLRSRFGGSSRGF